jgi:LysM repeat protein
MKKKLFCLIFAGFILLHFLSIGQTNHFPIKKINGSEFYVYTVEESEGLLAIGRKFEISAEEITKFNPSVNTGLKAGQQILIPVNKKNDGKTTPGFIQHKVENKQTLFAISHKYNVSQKDIEKFNPDLKTGLKEGMILNIPLPTKKDNSPNIVRNSTLPIGKLSENTINQKNSSESYKIHRVLPKETLFSISKTYNVDIADIVKLNPGAETKLSVNNELKIPIYPQKNNSINQSNEKVEVSSISSTNISKPIEKHFSAEQLTEKKIIKIAFLLPFMLEQTKKDPGLERFQHFYAGALLAIQKAKLNGYSIEIFTYDTENSEEKVIEVLNSPELRTVDLIIGPAFSNHVSLVSGFAKEFKINTVIPFSAKVSDIDDNPYIFQFNPGSDTEMKYFSELISGEFKNAHIVFANAQGINPTDDGLIKSEYILNQLIKENRTYSQIELSSPESTNFTNSLRKGVRNLIIFNSDKLVNINPYINLLRSNTNDYDITIFEQFSWRNQIDNFPQSIYISPFKQNFNPITLNDFNSKFDQFYGNNITVESPRFDLLGYDLTNLFVTVIRKYGSKFGSKIELPYSFTGIQSEPIFKRISNDSGFINQQVYLGEDKIIP